MINLLPPQRTAAIRYGRQNTVLRVWLIGMVVAIAGLIIIFGAGWVYINQQSKDLQRNIDATNQQLKTQDSEKIKAEAKEIKGDANVIDKVLSQEVNLSGLIQAIGSYMPAGTVLNGLSLSNDVSGSLDLTANASNYNSSAQIAVNLSDPQKNLFSKVDIISIDCGSSSNKNYRCTVVLRALFSKDAQVKYQSAATGAGQ